MYVFFFLYSLLASIPALAQVTPDGNTSTTVTSDGNNFTINDGARAGDNLFHSFSDFSVPIDGSAFFDNAPDIANIFSRVTGGNISNIDGLIRANGSANLFLINPAGIIFGAGARLDIGGSFFGSTADSILFPDDVAFSASDLQPPLLTINAPIGLGIRGNPGDIVHTSAADGFGLSVNEGKNISLIGGNVSVADGGIIFAPGGRIELGGLIEAGTINFNDDGSLSFPENIARSDVSLANGAIISTLSGGGGSITINARNFELLTGSRLIGGIGDGLGSADAQAGDITINATEDVSIDEGDSNSSTGIFSNVNTNAMGDAGSISISARNISFANGSFTASVVFGEGDGSDITLNAIDNISFDGDGVLPSGISSLVTSSGVGNTGNITISAQNISFTNGGILQSFTTGQGSTGNITINAIDTISFDGEGSVFSGINSFVNDGGVGNTGSINIATNNLSITNGARIASLVAGEGNTEDININATNSVIFDGLGTLNSGIFSNVAFTGVGDVGNINLSTSSLSLTNGGAIEADTVGTANAGDINVIVDSITLDGAGLLFTDQTSGFLSSQISSNVLSAEAEGNGGNITITTNSLTATNGGSLDAGTNGQGNSGTITINASDSVSFDGRFNEDVPSGIFSSVLPEGIGTGGIINIATREFSLSNGAQISSFTRGQGNGGIINIDVTDTANFSDGNIFAAVDELGRGNGGSINITTGSLLATNGSQFDSSTRGQGNAGNVVINATDTISFDGEDSEGFPSGAFSSVTENAVGNAGNIEINTNNLFVTNGAQISSSVFGIGDVGNIIINATDSVALDGEDSEGFASGVFSTVQETGIGNAGNLNITTNSLEIANGGTVTVSSLGQGSGGNIFIQAESITLDTGGDILASTPFGTGGNITLEVDDTILLEEGGEISAQALGNSNGGNITINADLIIATPNQNNDIVADAQQGNGGNISIEAEGIFGLEERSSNPDNDTNDLDVSSQEGLEGTISITTPDVDSTKGLTELPTTTIELGDTIAQVCSPTGTNTTASSFNITGKGGVPPLLTDPFTADKIYIDGEAVSLSEAEEEKEDRKFVTVIEREEPFRLADVVPARGMIIKENGDVILTAYPTPNTTGRIPSNSANCHS